MAVSAPSSAPPNPAHARATARFSGRGSVVCHSPITVTIPATAPSAARVAIERHSAGTSTAARSIGSVSTQSTVAGSTRTGPRIVAS
ncbi:hypothetical protein GCM10022402_28510 [Salinactinospora qingdaonensis]|uniref:Uncharacterized protein n=1 Tax=Salinactinospora qingdaonensis TaxID=702744 RepID=A0ABP7FVX1_9ACTN